MNKKISINYFFFFIWLSLLTSFTFGHLKFIEGNKTFFIIQCLVQNGFEVTFAFTLLALFQKLLPQKMVNVIIGATFFILLGRFINYVMINLMDTSIFYALNMVFGNGIKNIATNLQAAEINTTMLFALTSCMILTPIIGYYIYLLCDKLSKNKPLSISYSTIMRSIIIFVAVSLTCDIYNNISTDKNSSYSYKKRLPYSFSFIPSKDNQIICKKISFEVKNEEDVDNNIKSCNIKIDKKKNIFLFVIESFRKDSIDHITAPCLASFRDDNIHFKNSFSAANGTHPSWFSIFYSSYPIKWATYKKSWTGGATSLKLLKSLDYNINVFSSADLKYYNMDETIFGKNTELADSLIAYHDKQAWQRDKKAFTDLKEKSTTKGNNNLFIVFLDSTHSEYNLPDDFKPKFLPINTSINYLKFAYSHSDLSQLKNRYLNTVNYLDSLFSDFFTHLKNEGLYEDSIIVITGDHGEEFFEEGALFHGTHLNKYQTNIPIFYKLPDKTINDLSSQNMITSLQDIFPSILSNLTSSPIPHNILDGNSIFCDAPNPYCICSAQNGGDNSKQFAIYDQNKIIILDHVKDDLFKIVKINNLDDIK